VLVIWLFITKPINMMEFAEDWGPGIPCGLVLGGSLPGGGGLGTGGGGYDAQ
jgi:hypothetical protein